MDQANHQVKYDCTNCGNTKFKTVKKFPFKDTTKPRTTHKAKFACKECGQTTLDFQDITII